ncbi:hypothetical protein N7492_006009 [Penicillium capsulatum]|uniref:Uncharacterized protein n=1 Tax=Penicillium capsulatum TaxID=69766 RepID=A0A9W9IDI7_9EURO|nr:hypothetical protein N7492_006009 [Penicillium capsulatum]
MDARLGSSQSIEIHPTILTSLDTARALGLEEGDAHVIRNAGGRVSEALRSIVISQQLLGTREIIITDCGMLTFTDEVIRGKIRTELHQNVDHIAFLPFADLWQSVRDDIQLLRDSPLVLEVPITGYVYEVESGKIIKVE